MFALLVCFACSCWLCVFFFPLGFCFPIAFVQHVLLPLLAAVYSVVGMSCSLCSSFSSFSFSFELIVCLLYVCFPPLVSVLAITCPCSAVDLRAPVTVGECVCKRKAKPSRHSKARGKALHACAPGAGPMPPSTPPPLRTQTEQVAIMRPFPPFTSCPVQAEQRFMFPLQSPAPPIHTQSTPSDLSTLNSTLMPIPSPSPSTHTHNANRPLHPSK